MRHAALLLLFLTGCSAPQVSFTLQGSLDRTAIDQWRRHGSQPYRDRSELLEALLAAPPAQTVYRTATPSLTTPWRPFDPLLAFLHTGPGGGAVTEQHLQAIQGPLLALGAIAQGLTLSQLLATPQGQTAIAAVRNVFDPLGLWTLAVLAWLRSNAARLRSILTGLYRELTAGPPTSAPRPPVVVFDPVDAAAALIELWRGEDWLEISWRGPPLIHSLTRHLGYLEPQVLLYGTREGYKPAVILEQPGGVVHAVSEAGYTTNESGRHRYHQGPDDLTLSYYLADVSRGRVTTPDVEASGLFAWAKAASGGDVSLLDRARSPDGSRVALDLGWGGTHLRIAAGATAHDRLAGVFVEQRLGGSLGELRGAVGFLYLDGPLGYAEAEGTLRTPRLKAKGEGGAAAAWLQGTIALAGLVSDRGAIQGDARLIPEACAQLNLGPLRIDLTAGATFALVPHGRVDLGHPLRSLSVQHVRTHLVLDVTAKAGPVGLSWGAAVEASALRTRVSLRTGIEVEGLGVQLVADLDAFSDYVEAFVGAAASYGGFSVSALQRTDGEDYRLRAGYEIRF